MNAAKNAYTAGYHAYYIHAELGEPVFPVSRFILELNRLITNRPETVDSVMRFQHNRLTTCYVLGALQATRDSIATAQMEQSA